MSIVFGIAIYFIIWWITLFAVLPFNIRTQGEAGEVVPGTPSSAPAHVKLLRIFLINTVVAAVFFCVVWFVLEYELITPDLFTLRDRSPV